MSKAKLPYVREVLPNGLTVLIYPMRDVQAAGVSLKVHTGTIYEEEEEGLAHATEHFLFLATKKFPTERKVREELEGIGAANNAHTRNREIELWIHLPAKNLERALSLMSQMAFYPIFPADSLEKERSTVIQEWKNRHDLPRFRFGQKLHEARFGDPKHPYIRDESLHLLESFSLSDLKKFHDKFFHPQQMVLGVGGGVEPKKTLLLIKKYFADIPKTTFVPEPVFASGSYAGKVVIAHEEKSSQAHFEMNFPAFGWRQKSKRERMAVFMGARILGGSTVSRLWRELREERGWVYHVGSGVSLYPYLGISDVFTSCTTGRLGEVMKILRKEIEKFVSCGPTDAEVALEREHRLGRLATGFEGSLGTARYFVDEEFDGEGIMLPEEEMAMIQGISKDQIKLSLQDLFDWSRGQVGLMNDFTQIAKDDFEKLANDIFR
jgi:predicted Zn-dependent peptidase